MNPKTWRTFNLFECLLPLPFLPNQIFKDQINAMVGGGDGSRGLGGAGARSRAVHAHLAATLGRSTTRVVRSPLPWGEDPEGAAAGEDAALADAIRHMDLSRWVRGVGTNMGCVRAGRREEVGRGKGGRGRGSMAVGALRVCWLEGGGLGGRHLPHGPHHVTWVWAWLRVKARGAGRGGNESVLWGRGQAAGLHWDEGWGSEALAGYEWVCKVCPMRRWAPLYLTTTSRAGGKTPSGPLDVLMRYRRPLLHSIHMLPYVHSATLDLILPPGLAASRPPGPWRCSCARRPRWHGSTARGSAAARGLGRRRRAAGGRTTRPAPGVCQVTVRRLGQLTYRDMRMDLCSIA